MQQQPLEPVPPSNNWQLVHGLLKQSLARDELTVPLLPEVAIRVLRASADKDSSAKDLSDIINADPALTMYVLGIAGSAALHPLIPVVSLQQAVAWLGFDEVANIAFTLALQGAMIDVPGQQHKARGLWRDSLAAALWSRQLARMLNQDVEVCYLCGLLHNIGKIVTLGAIYQLARHSSKKLASEDYDRLIESFHRHIGARVVTAWRLPTPVFNVVTEWETYAGAGAARIDCNIVNVGHCLADYMLQDSSPLAWDLLVGGTAYRDLGLEAGADARLFESVGPLNDEVDRYLTA